MGSPILNAVSDGVQIATIRGGDIEHQSTEDLWDDINEPDDGDEILPSDEEKVKIEVVYRTQEADKQGDKEGIMITGYIVLLAAIIVVILVVMIVVCCYNRIAIRINIDKKTEASHAQQEGKFGRKLSLQYDPKADIDDIVMSSKNSARGDSRNSARHSSRNSARPLNLPNIAPTPEKIGMYQDVQDKSGVSTAAKMKELDESEGPVFSEKDSKLARDFERMKQKGKNMDELSVMRP